MAGVCFRPITDVETNQIYSACCFTLWHYDGVMKIYFLNANILTINDTKQCSFPGILCHCTLR